MIVKNQNLKLMFNEKKKYLVLVFFLYLSLLAGLFFEENLLHGAKTDYFSISKSLNIFESDVLYYFNNYKEIGLRHSPIFQLIHIVFLKMFDNDIIFKLTIIHTNLLILVFFYLCMKIKIKNNLLILASVLFIFPSFRSYSIWPDSFLFGFIFFIISIYFILKFIESDDNKKIYYAYFNIISLAISSYVSPNFATFSIFYLYIFYKYLKFSNSLMKLIFLNFILAIPAFIYIFIMNNNFLDFDGSRWVKDLSTLSLVNLANKIIVLPTIFVIYFIPFLIVDFKLTKIFLNKQTKKLNYSHYLIILLPFLFLKYFSYNEISDALGGAGLFYNLFKTFNFFEFLICTISSISIFIILLFTINNLKSSIFIICLILSNPQLTIYTIYFDLILVTCIFLFFNNNILKFEEMFKNRNNSIKFFLYYLFILSLYIFKQDYYTFIKNI